MLGWIFRVVFGRFASCKHKWLDVDEYKSSGPDGCIKSITTVMKCDKCGERKSHAVGLPGWA